MSKILEWKDIVRPGTVNLIVGHKGKGKSGLGYYLLQEITPVYKLSPVVVNFPKEKQYLLPENYVVADLAAALAKENAIILIDEGTTQLPAGGKLEEFIKACSSLTRQKDQVIIFIFHASRDIGSRILRGIDALMIKEPSRRQIEQGSKDKYFRDLLVRAKQEIRAQPGERRSITYIDSEEPEYTGLISNSLPEFWSEDLSKAWRGVALSSLLNLSPEDESLDLLLELDIIYREVHQIAYDYWDLTPGLREKLLAFGKALKPFRNALEVISPDRLKQLYQPLLLVPEEETAECVPFQRLRNKLDRLTTAS